MAAVSGTGPDTGRARRRGGTRGMGPAVTALAAALALAGCVGERIVFGAGSPKYDGAWVGQFSLSVRTEGCRLTRGGLRVTIAEGTLDGKLRQPDRLARFSGVVTEDGTLDGAYIPGEYDSEDADLTGRFDAEAGRADGTWQSEYCRGRWNLRRIR